MNIRKDKRQGEQPAELPYRLMFQQNETLCSIYREKTKGSYRRGMRFNFNNSVQRESTGIEMPSIGWEPSPLTLPNLECRTKNVRLP